MQDVEGLNMHVAIIMDGNGRWAERRGLPRIQGHREGLKRVEELVKYAPKKGVRFLTLYAFSTENWRRPPKEREFLFSLFEMYLKQKRDDLKSGGIRLKIIGLRDRLPEHLVSLIEETETYLREGNNLTLQIAFNYGGRAEIVYAVNRLLAEGKAIGRVDEEVFSQYLFTSGVPDPDLLVRTSGEMRISNFLLWQCAYTEFYFTDVLWPDFTEAEFDKALQEFSRRRRRFGGI